MARGLSWSSTSHQHQDSGVVPANQTEDSEVRDLSGRSPELVPDPTFKVGLHRVYKEKGLPEPVPDSFLKVCEPHFLRFLLLEPLTKDSGRVRLREVQNTWISTLLNSPPLSKRTTRHSTSVKTLSESIALYRAAVKFSLKPRLEVAMENAVKFLVWNLAVPLSSGNKDRSAQKFHDDFVPFFTRRFAVAKSHFHGVFTMQMFVFEGWTQSRTGRQHPSPDVKNPLQLRAGICLEMIISCDARVLPALEELQAPALAQQQACSCIQTQACQTGWATPWSSQCLGQCTSNVPKQIQTITAMSDNDLNSPIFYTRIQEQFRQTKVGFADFLRRSPEQSSQPFPAWKSVEKGFANHVPDSLPKSSWRTPFPLVWFAGATSEKRWGFPLAFHEVGASRTRPRPCSATCWKDLAPNTKQRRMPISGTSKEVLFITFRCLKLGLWGQPQVGWQSLRRPPQNGLGPTVMILSCCTCRRGDQSATSPLFQSLATHGPADLTRHPTFRQLRTSLMAAQRMLPHLPTLLLQPLQHCLRCWIKPQHLLEVRAVREDWKVRLHKEEWASSTLENKRTTSMKAKAHGSAISRQCYFFVSGGWIAKEFLLAILDRNLLPGKQLSISLSCMQWFGGLSWCHHVQNLSHESNAASETISDVFVAIPCPGPQQGRALYGPILVKTETFRELWAPLVHTNFGGGSYGLIIGPYLFLGKFVWTNGPERSSKVSPYTGIGPGMAIHSTANTMPVM